MPSSLIVASNGTYTYDAKGYSSILEGYGSIVWSNTIFSNVGTGTTFWIEGNWGNNVLDSLSKLTTCSLLNVSLGIDSNKLPTALSGLSITNGVTASISVNGSIPTVNISSLGSGGTGYNTIVLAGGGNLLQQTINVSGDQNLSLYTDANYSSKINVSASDISAVNIHNNFRADSSPVTGHAIIGGGGLLTVDQELTYLSTSNYIFGQFSSPNDPAISSPNSIILGSTGISDPCTSPNDSLTSGAGGVNVTLGYGGAWNFSKKVIVGGITYYGASGTGSETVNLTASSNKVDTIICPQGSVSVSNGTIGGIKGFKIAASTSADLLTFRNNPFYQQCLANTNQAKHLSALSDFSLANVLDHSGVLANHLNSLQFKSSNGVITFSTIGSATLSGFTATELIDAAQLIVDDGSAYNTAIFEKGGNTYVVAKDPGGISLNNTYTTDNNTVLELLGVTGVTGFGSTASGNTILTNNVINNVAPSLSNSGSVAKAIYNAAGYSSLTETSVPLGTTSTTINGLASSAIIALSSAFSHAININQVGAKGTNSLTCDNNNAGMVVTISSLTLSGDWYAAINASPLASSTNILSLVDGGGSNATLKNLIIKAAHLNSITINSITDSALTLIDASASTGNITLGSITSPLTNAGITINLGTTESNALLGTESQTVFANGSNTTIRQASGGNGGLLSINALGNNDVLSFATTSTQSKYITIAGTGDAVTLNGGASGIAYVGGSLSESGGEHATAHTGANNTFTLSGIGSTDNIWVGLGNIVNIDSTFQGIANIKVAGDKYGSGAGLVTLNGAQAFITANTPGTQAIIDFSDSALTGGVKLAGSAPNATTLATAKVNESSITTLANALNQAAMFSGKIVAHGGVIDWFQFNGNTYIMESENTGAASAAHPVLGTNDVVVKLTGLVDLSNAHFNAGVVTLFHA